ncbi:hypothetical protein GAG94_03425 [Lysinibacillus sphaericus]|nr:hypothetical protein GAG94_03425 [Lysinibacillus sphaericus]
MASKEIYYTSNSKCLVEFNGETVSITQKVGEGEQEESHKVYLYEDELQSISEYIETLKINSK